MTSWGGLVIVSALYRQLNQRFPMWVPWSLVLGILVQFFVSIIGYSWYWESGRAVSGGVLASNVATIGLALHNLVIALYVYFRSRQVLVRFISATTPLPSTQLVQQHSTSVKPAAGGVLASPLTITVAPAPEKAADSAPPLNVNGAAPITILISPLNTGSNGSANSSATTVAPPVSTVIVPPTSGDSRTNTPNFSSKPAMVVVAVGSGETAPPAAGGDEQSGLSRVLPGHSPPRSITPLPTAVQLQPPSPQATTQMAPPTPSKPSAISGGGGAGMHDHIHSALRRYFVQILLLTLMVTIICVVFGVSVASRIADSKRIDADLSVSTTFRSNQSVVFYVLYLIQIVWIGMAYPLHTAHAASSSPAAAATAAGPASHQRTTR